MPRTTIARDTLASDFEDSAVAARSAVARRSVEISGRIEGECAAGVLAVAPAAERIEISAFSQLPVRALFELVNGTGVVRAAEDRRSEQVPRRVGDEAAVRCAAVARAAERMQNSSVHCPFAPRTSSKATPLPVVPPSIASPLHFPCRTGGARHKGLRLRRCW